MSRQAIRKHSRVIALLSPASLAACAKKDATPADTTSAIAPAAQAEQMAGAALKKAFGA